MSHSFALLESILWHRDEGYWLLERHLERLKNSCQVLGFSYDQRAVDDALKACVKGLLGENYKTRFEFHKSGEIKMGAEEIKPIPSTMVWNIAIAPHPLNSDDPLNFHKTTKRDVYNAALKWGQERGANEVILENEMGQICEGSFCNIFLEYEGHLITPPLKNGLLAGTLRRELIAKEKAFEAEISREMLDGAEFFMGNSVRGLIRARLIHP